MPHPLPPWLGWKLGLPRETRWTFPIPMRCTWPPSMRMARLPFARCFVAALTSVVWSFIPTTSHANRRPWWLRVVHRCCSIGIKPIAKSGSKGASPKSNLKFRTRTSQRGTRRVSWAPGPVSRASLCRTEPSLRKKSKPCGPNFRVHRAETTVLGWLPRQFGCRRDLAGPSASFARSGALDRFRRWCVLCDEAVSLKQSQTAEDAALQLGCRAFSSMRPQRSVNPPLMGASPSGPNSAQSKI